MKPVILGEYSFQNGGSIYLPMGVNLKYQTGAITEIHEIFHSHLQLASVAGILMSLIDIERECAETSDQEWAARMGKANRILGHRTRMVQEIYANSMELAFLYHHSGAGAMWEQYETKPEGYKQLCGWFLPCIEDSQVDYGTVSSVITGLCVQALFMEIDVSEWQGIFENEGNLTEFLDRHGYFEQRFYHLYQEWKTRNITVSGSTEQLEPEQLFKKLRLTGLFKYCLDLAEEGMKKARSMNLEGMDYIEKQTEKVKTFDVSRISVNTKIDEKMLYPEAVFVIKNCYGLERKENFFVLGRADMEDGSHYAGYEWNTEQLVKFQKDAEFLIIPFAEYDVSGRTAKYLPEKPGLLFVMIDSFYDCQEWLKKWKGNAELFTGDLFRKEVESFFTVLFFSVRGKPDTVFVYPTTRELAERLKVFIGAYDDILYSEEAEFLKIFAGFGSTLSVMKGMQWLFAFLTNHKVGGVKREAPESWLGIDLFRAIMDSVLQMKDISYFRNMARLPTRSTSGSPFWVLMEFLDGKNTGSMKSDERGLLIFPTKETAEGWNLQIRMAGKDRIKYSAVGLDRYFWEFVVKALRKVKQKVCLCIDVEKGLFLNADLERLDQMVGSERLHHLQPVVKCKKSVDRKV